MIFKSPFLFNMTNVKLDIFFNSTDPLYSMNKIMLGTEDCVLDEQFHEDINQGDC